MDPVYATNRFFSVLEEIPDYESLPITVAAQQVQRSAYPEAYADHEGEGKAFASALTGHSPGALNCVLKAAESAGDPAEVEAALEVSHPGLETAVEDGTLRVEASDRTGWAVAQWAVASAKELNIESVSYAGLSWQRSDGDWLAAGSETGTVVITVADQP
jgi:hypothetical protein